MKRNRSIELRVGAFVMTALLVGGSIAFVIGNQRNVFKAKTTYTAIYEDVGGLRPGSPVRVAGVTVGTVTAVEFNDQGTITVGFTIIDSARDLIVGTPEECTAERRETRQDLRDQHGAAIRRALSDGEEPPVFEPVPLCSVSTIGSKGMLGDRLIDISVGRGLAQWDPEMPLPNGEEGGLTAMLDAAGDTLSSVSGVASNMRLATDPLADQRFTEDLKNTAHNLAEITGMLANGEGAAQRLMTDPAMGDEVAATLLSFRRTSDELARTARNIRAITEELRSGDGTAHEILYGSSGTEAMTNIGRAADEVAVILHDVREGEGTAHDVLYGNTADDLLANLTSASADFAAITADVRAGRGTIGGLLQDPSIYEDVKRLVGDLQRNEILRALVRYSIRRDEAVERVDVANEE